MLTLEEASLIGLINVTRDDDAFGIHAFARRYGEAPHAMRAEGLLDVHMDEVLSGRWSGRATVVADLLSGGHHPYDGATTVDRLGAAMLAHHGVDPATMCAIALRMDGPMTVVRRIERGRAATRIGFDDLGHSTEPLATVEAASDLDAPHDETCGVVMHLTGIDVATTRGHLGFANAPSLIQAGLGASRARWVSDLVDHPVLSRWHLPITGRDDDPPNGEGPILTFDARSVCALGEEELATMQAG